MRMHVIAGYTTSAKGDNVGTDIEIIRRESLSAIHKADDHRIDEPWKVKMVAEHLREIRLAAQRAEKGAEEVPGDLALSRLMLDLRLNADPLTKQLRALYTRREWKQVRGRIEELELYRAMMWRFYTREKYVDRDTFERIKVRLRVDVRRIVPKDEKIYFIQ